MKRSRVLAGLLVVVMVLALAGCGGGGGGSDAGSSDGEPIVIRIASDETKETPCSEATVIFKDLVEKNSDGRITVEYFSDSAMGDEREIAESVNMGTLEMGIVAGAYMATYAPDWYVTDLPYAFTDRETMYGLLDGEVGDYLKNSIAEKSNIRALDFADGSFKALLNATKEITSVSDLSRMKFRVQENQMNMALYKSWGSTAVPMGMSEVYTAMQQGAIDGVDSSPLYLESQGFYEVGTSFTLTNHQVILMVSIINQDFLNGLPEDLQKVVLDASHEAYTVQEREIVVDAEQECCRIMEESGCKQYVLTDKQRNTFIEASKPVIEEYRDTIAPEVYEMMGF